jgi:hypothetical protein
VCLSYKNLRRGTNGWRVKVDGGGIGCTAAAGFRNPCLKNVLFGGAGATGGAAAFFFGAGAGGVVLTEGALNPGLKNVSFDGTEAGGSEVDFFGGILRCPEQCGRAGTVCFETYSVTSMEKFEAGSFTATGMKDAGRAWDSYPEIPFKALKAMESIITPFAYKTLHSHPDAFKQIFGLLQTGFSELPIFQISPPDGLVVESILATERSSIYAPVFAASHSKVMLNNRIAQHNLHVWKTQDLGLLEDLEDMHLLLIFEKINEEKDVILRGFCPYFVFFDVDRHYYYFFHAALARLVLICAPSAHRMLAINFITEHCVHHSFQKFCAGCGKSSDLLKCRCKMVRYCGSKCQLAHWPAHKTECRSACKA